MLPRHTEGKKTRVYFLLPLFPILLLIETQIVSEETARRLITVLLSWSGWQTAS